MELTLAQESGQAVGEDGYPSSDDNDDTQSSSRPRPSSHSYQNGDEEDTWHGTGVTATTSKARLWLARWALRTGDLDRADQLAGELCQDGVEVEEAKALMRDVRARKEGG
jgi:anaphase-promoting complex subunit 8